MKDLIEWQILAQQLGTLRPSGESGGDAPARRALDVIIGREQLRAAVDHYLAYRPGRELVRSVLHILHSWTATQYCYEVYHSKANLEVRRAAVELLRFIADSRALAWVEEFLADEDGEIQGWGLALVDQLLFSGRAFPEECGLLLDKAEQHTNPHIRERAAEIKRSFPSLKEQKNGVPLSSGATVVQSNIGTPRLVGNEVEVQAHHDLDQRGLTLGAATEAVVPGPTVHPPVAAKDLPIPQEQSTLHTAVEQGNVEAVAVLLANSAPVNEQNTLGRTPLTIAAEAGYTAIVQALLTHGAATDIPDLRGYTPLLAAADKGNTDIVRLLLEAKAEVNAKSINGDTALMFAAVGGHKETVSVLLEKGAVVSTRNRFGRTALMMAACSGKPTIVEALLTKGASINTQDWRGHCALIDALRVGHEDVAVLLLAYGAAVNAQDSLRRTPLLLAAEKGYAPIVQTLLAKGVSVNVQDETGRTPLFVAVEHAHLDVVKLLLNAGALSSISDNQDRTAVMVAKELGNDAILQLLSRGRTRT